MKRNISKVKFLFEALRSLNGYIYGDFLDFGCGEGRFTCFAKKFFSISSVDGYDLNKRKINIALKKKGVDNVFFTSSVNDLNRGWYDSSLLSFVVHESGLDVLDSIYSYIRIGGKVCVIDYDLCEMSRDDFSKFFNSKCEMKEIEKYGLDRAWKIHTARGLDDCVRDGEIAGFSTIKTEIIRDNYFLWVGQK